MGRPARAAPVRLSWRTSLAPRRHPLWIALTAPGRWVSDRFRKHPASRRTGERTLTALLLAAAHPARQRLSNSVSVSAPGLLEHTLAQIRPLAAGYLQAWRRAMPIRHRA